LERSPGALYYIWINATLQFAPQGVDVAIVGGPVYRLHINQAPTNVDESEPDFLGVGPITVASPVGGLQVRISEG